MPLNSKFSLSPYPLLNISFHKTICIYLFTYIVTITVLVIRFPPPPQPKVDSFLSIAQLILKLDLFDA